MSLYGYRLVGSAKSTLPGYIPSLIGVLPDQIDAADKDAYFETIELPPEAVNLNTVGLTKWVSYDSLPSEYRDPIVAVKAAGVSYYSTLSELTDMVGEHGSKEARAIVRMLAEKLI